MDNFFNSDYHVHTNYSYCGSLEMTVERIANLVKRKGIERVAITDHSPHFYFERDESWGYQYLRNPGMFESVREKGNKRVEEYLERVKKFRSAGILTGMEIDYTVEGEPILDPQYFKELDIIIGSIHWLPCLDDKNNLSKEDFISEFLNFTQRILERKIDILAHPTRIFKWHNRNLEVPREVVDQVIDAAITNNVALEINSHSKDPDVFFIKRCLDKRAKIAIGTDAHSLEEFGDFSYHQRILGTCGVKKEELEKILYKYEFL